MRFQVSGFSACQPLADSGVSVQVSVVRRASRHERPKPVILHFIGFICLIGLNEVSGVSNIRVSGVSVLGTFKK